MFISRSKLKPDSVFEVLFINQNDNWFVKACRKNDSQVKFEIVLQNK